MALEVEDPSQRPVPALNPDPETLARGLYDFCVENLLIDPNQQVVDADGMIVKHHDKTPDDLINFEEGLIAFGLRSLVSGFHQRCLVVAVKLHHRSGLRTEREIADLLNIHTGIDLSHGGYKLGIYGVEAPAFEREYFFRGMAELESNRESDDPNHLVPVDWREWQKELFPELSINASG